MAVSMVKRVEDAARQALEIDPAKEKKSDKLGVWICQTVDIDSNGDGRLDGTVGFGYQSTRNSWLNELPQPNADFRSFAFFAPFDQSRATQVIGITGESFRETTLVGGYDAHAIDEHPSSPPSCYQQNIGKVQAGEYNLEAGTDVRFSLASRTYFVGNRGKTVKLPAEDLLLSVDSNAVISINAFSSVENK